MPDPKSNPPPASSSESKPAAKSRKLAPAAESTDPAVHQLLAERQTHAMNDDVNGINEVDRALTKLGLFAE